MLLLKNMNLLDQTKVGQIIYLTIVLDVVIRIFFTDLSLFLYMILK